MIYKTHKVIVYAQITEYFMEVLHQTYPGTLGSVITHSGTLAAEVTLPTARSVGL